MTSDPNRAPNQRSRRGTSGEERRGKDRREDGKRGWICTEEFDERAVRRSGWFSNRRSQNCYRQRQQSNESIRTAEEGDKVVFVLCCLFVW